jgi:hypothetical protein
MNPGADKWRLALPIGQCTNGNADYARRLARLAIDYREQFAILESSNTRRYVSFSPAIVPL